MKTGTLALLATLKTERLADLGPNRRAGTLSRTRIDSGLRSAPRESRPGDALPDLLRAAIYLWHDHLDEAHRIVQPLEGADASWIHGIMHRREPDYGNSKYWFRRAGHHPAFAALARQAGELLAGRQEIELRARLTPNQTWDPLAFVDAVAEAADGPLAPKAPLLREIQKLEFECLIEHLAGRIA